MRRDAAKCDPTRPLERLTERPYRPRLVERCGMRARLAPRTRRALEPNRRCRQSALTPSAAAAEFYRKRLSARNWGELANSRPSSARLAPPAHGPNAPAIDGTRCRITPGSTHAVRSSSVIGLVVHAARGPPARRTNPSPCGVPATPALRRLISRRTGSPGTAGRELLTEGNRLSRRCPTSGLHRALRKAVLSDATTRKAGRLARGCWPSVRPGHESL